jgi:hypothetical protein
LRDRDFTEATKHLSEYVAVKGEDAGDFRNGMKERSFAVLVSPNPPADTTDVVQMEIWKVDLRV